MQIDALRADGAIVVSQTLLTPVPAPPAAALYDVATRQVMTQEAHDFGLQLMTTVSTLVVAVAGFYFGSRAVSQATTTVSEQLRLSRSYSRRGVIGTKPEPGVETEEAPGEVIENELGSTEETDEDVEQEPPNDDDSEGGDAATATQVTATTARISMTTTPSPPRSPTARRAANRRPQQPEKPPQQPGQPPPGM